MADLVIRTAENFLISSRDCFENFSTFASEESIVKLWNNEISSFLTAEKESKQ